MTERLGPTGRFPQGKAHPNDEGELRFAVGSDPVQRLVILDFGAPVACIALPPQELTQLLTALARHLARITAQPVKIEIEAGT